MSWTRLLLDLFTTPDDDPITSPRSCEPTGSLTFVQTDGGQEIADAKHKFTAQDTPAWGDQGFYDTDGQTRDSGLALFDTLNLSTWEECGIGWHTAAAVVDPDSMEHAIQAVTADGELQTERGTPIATGLSTSTDYELVQILRAVGCHYALDGQLVWVEEEANQDTAALRPSFANLDGAGSNDDLSVVDLPDNGIAEWDEDFSKVEPFDSSAPADLCFHSEFTYEAGKYIQFGFRWFGASDRWYSYAVSNGRYRLVKVEGGGSSNIVSISGVFQGGIDYVVDTYAVGDSIIARINGIELANITNDYLETEEGVGMYDTHVGPITNTIHPYPAPGIVTNRIIQPIESETTTHAADCVVYFRGITLPVAGSLQYELRKSGGDEITLDIDSSGKPTILENGVARITGSNSDVADGDDACVRLNDDTVDLFVEGAIIGSPYELLTLTSGTGFNMLSKGTDGWTRSADFFPQDVAALLSEGGAVIAADTATSASTGVNPALNAAVKIAAAVAVSVSAAVAPTINAATVISAATATSTSAAINPSIVAATTVAAATAASTSAGVNPTVNAAAGIATATATSVSAGVNPTVNAATAVTATTAASVSAGVDPSVVAVTDTVIATDTAASVSTGVNPGINAGVRIASAVATSASVGVGPSINAAAAIAATTPSTTSAGVNPSINAATRIAAATATSASAGVGPTVNAASSIATDTAASSSAGVNPAINAATAVAATTSASVSAGVDPTIVYTGAVVIAADTAASVSAAVNPAVNAKTKIDAAVAASTSVAVNPGINAATRVQAATATSVSVGVGPTVAATRAIAVDPGASVSAGVNPAVNASTRIAAATASSTSAGVNPAIRTATGIRAATAQSASAGANPTIAAAHGIVTATAASTSVGVNPAINATTSIQVATAASASAGVNPAVFAPVAIQVTTAASISAGVNPQIDLGTTVIPVTTAASISAGVNPAIAAVEVYVSNIGARYEDPCSVAVIDGRCSVVMVGGLHGEH